MKIKTIEKVIKLEDLFNILKETLDPKYQMKSNSFIQEKSLLIIGKDKKSRYLQIAAFLDLEFKRTLIYISAINNKSALENLKITTDKVFDKNSFFNLINSINAEEISKKSKIEFNEIEEKILKKLLKKIRIEFNQKDKILNYPFSLAGLEDFDSDLHLKYSEYLDIIERNLIKYGIKSSQIFRYYDFAKNSEFYQRIIDLVIISDKFIENPKDNVHWILFIYSNKTQEKFKLLELVKFFGEISKYSALIHKRLKNRKIIRPALVVLSANGFEKSLANYLRNHIYGEFEHTPPIFIIPPSGNNIWHNLNQDRSLTKDLAFKKKEIKGKISRLRKIVNPAPYRKEQIESEKKVLTDIKDRIDNVEKNYTLIEIFTELLSIKDFYRIFELKPQKSNFKQDKVNKSKELLFI